MATDTSDTSESATRNRSRISTVVAQLTTANAAATLLGLVTGPILARALGPAGRGSLAAIVVPFSLAPFILSVGLPTFAAKVTAQGRSVAVLIGSVGGVAFVIGLISVPLAGPVASLLAEGRDTVHSWLVIGLMTLPIALPSLVILGIATGLEQWNLLAAARVFGPLVTVVAFVVLALAGKLTVASAAAVTIVGTTTAISPVLPVLRGTGRPVVVLSVAREALSFGSRIWAANLASLANFRLDQVLMIPLVEPRELGLYAVAVTLSGFGSVLTGAVASAVTPAIARGDRELPARALRITLAVLGSASAVLALATPLLLPGLFGRQFEDAVPMAWILLVAGLPLAGVFVLTTVLSNAERPGLPAVGEFVALAITIPGLVVLLPPLGGVGAALVSLMAYSADFVLLLVFSKRHFGGRLASYLLPRREDLAWARSLAPALFSRRERKD